TLPRTSQPRDQQLALEDNLFRNKGIYLHKKLILQENFTPPFFDVDALHLLELRGRKPGQITQIKILGPWQPAQRRFARADAAMAAVDDPLKHPHILAESWPQKLDVVPFSE